MKRVDGFKVISRKTAAGTLLATSTVRLHALLGIRSAQGDTPVTPTAFTNGANLAGEPRRSENGRAWEGRREAPANPAEWPGCDRKEEEHGLG